MRFPSKVTSYNESILPLASSMAKHVTKEGVSVLDLFQRARKEGIGIADFFQILDFLFMIGTVTLNQNKEVCHVG